MSTNLFSPFVTVENVPLPVDGSGSTQPVSGSVSVSNFPATQPVSGTVSISGTVSTTSAVASTAAITRVATSGTSVLLLAANANRRAAVIMTEVGSSNYLAYAATASLTSYTVLLGAAAMLTVSGYTGPISMIRSSGNGNVQVTELT